MTNNFVYELTRRPFNLTATVVSNSNLTTLHWSPPESSDHPPSRTITVHHGNTTTTTFMLLGDATLGDSGNYTLTAVNECGENSSQIKVEVVTGNFNVCIVGDFVLLCSSKWYNKLCHCISLVPLLVHVCPKESL